jgi:hypothetical protein
MPAVAGQDADERVPSELCVIIGRGDDFEPASATQTAATIASSSSQMIVHPVGPHLSSPKAMTRRNGVPGGPCGPGAPAIPASPLSPWSPFWPATPCGPAAPFGPGGPCGPSKHPESARENRPAVRRLTTRMIRSDRQNRKCRPTAKRQFRTEDTQARWDAPSSSRSIHKTGQRLFQGGRQNSPSVWQTEPSPDAVRGQYASPRWCRPKLGRECSKLPRRVVLIRQPVDCRLLQVRLPWSIDQIIPID